jgi:hypothetical protein
VIAIFKGGQVIYRQSGSQITGEKIPGDLETWNTYAIDINDAVTASYEKLSKRSSTLYHSYPPISSAVNKTSFYAIGSGNIFRSHPDYRILGISPDAAKEWGKQFQLLIHYYFKKLSWYKKQGIVFRGALVAGDSLVFFVRENGSFDLVASGGNNIDWEYTDDENWTLGIKHDKWKRRSAARINDKTINFKNQKTKDQQIIQFYIQNLPAQLRGFSLAYKIIALAKNHDRHMDATVQRAVLESIMMAYSNTDETDFGKQIKQQVEAASKKKEGFFRNAFSRLTGSRDLQGGNVYQLKTGESVNFTDLKTPSRNFGDFNDIMIKFIAMATDTTPGVILSNYPTSYSSHRGEFNDFWKMVLVKRNLFNETVNKVVIREIAKELILAGKIKAPGFFTDEIIQEAWLAGSFLGPVPGQINPKQEVDAYKIAVENSFMLRSDVAALYGNEWDNEIEQWGEEEKKFNELSPAEKETAIQEGMQDVE